MNNNNNRIKLKSEIVKKRRNKENTSERLRLSPCLLILSQTLKIEFLYLNSAHKKVKKSGELNHTRLVEKKKLFRSEGENSKIFSGLWPDP